MSESEILFDLKDGLGLITLNRPKALNALTHGMILELEKVIPAGMTLLSTMPDASDGP